MNKELISSWFQSLQDRITYDLEVLDGKSKIKEDSWLRDGGGGGRTESILMSLPPTANWAYDYQPDEGSKEADTIAKLKKGINWV
ncbi:MAG: coproporphyrinogen III oxidase [Cytophagales bacterium]|nr:coproporphyrinogen III oxidase [Cytophagales bacterium]